VYIFEHLSRWQAPAKHFLSYECPRMSKHGLDLKGLGCLQNQDFLDSLGPQNKVGQVREPSKRYSGLLKAELLERPKLLVTILLEYDFFLKNDGAVVPSLDGILKLKDHWILRSDDVIAYVG